MFKGASLWGNNDITSSHYVALASVSTYGRALLGGTHGHEANWQRESKFTSRTGGEWPCGYLSDVAELPVNQN